MNGRLHARKNKCERIPCPKLTDLCFGVAFLKLHDLYNAKLVELQLVVRCVVDVVVLLRGFVLIFVVDNCVDI